jgi:hypothetical protein
MVTPVVVESSAVEMATPVVVTSGAVNNAAIRWYS